MNASGASIRHQLGVEDERLERRIRSWTVALTLFGVVVVSIGFLSSWYAMSRVVDAKARLQLVNSSLKVAHDSSMKLDSVIREQQRQQLALQQVVGKLNTAAARTNERMATSALEQAVASTPGAALVVPIVYIQFRGGLSRSVVEGLRSQLNNAGYSAPGTERIDRSFTSGLYYFRAEDRDLALAVAQRSEAFFRDRGCPVKLPLRYASRFARTAKVRQVELWVNTNCPGII